MDELSAWIDHIADSDELFTATTHLMWHLLYRAEDLSMRWAAEDLLVAVGRLGTGPWTHLGGAPPVHMGLPFSVLGTALDRMLDRLEVLTPGFGARTAIAQARYWLDPSHTPARGLTIAVTIEPDLDPG